MVYVRSRTSIFDKKYSYNEVFGDLLRKIENSDTTSDIHNSLFKSAKTGKRVRCIYSKKRCLNGKIEWIQGGRFVCMEN